MKHHTKLFYTTGGAAELLNCSTQAVRNFMEEGKILADGSDGGRLLIPASEVQRQGPVQAAPVDEEEANGGGATLMVR